MNFVRQYKKLSTFSITIARAVNRYKKLAKNSASFRQLKTGQTMERCASSLPYHVHKVNVSQESVETTGRVIEFEIAVIDTHPGDKEKPTVVGIHGAPGSADNFEPCIRWLLENNVRFIGPTFPGSEGSEIESWKLYHLDYSTTGLATVVLQVMDSLGINKANMVMCHSAGAWVGYNLAAETDRVKSLCLMNPVGAKPHRALRPFYATQFTAWLMRIQSLHFLLMPLLEVAYSVVGFTGVKGGDHLMAAQQVVTSHNFDDTKQHGIEIQKKQIPLVFAYSLNDKLIEQSAYEEMLFQHLNVPKSSLIKVDTEKKQSPFFGSSVDSEPRTGLFARGLQFERGGHIVHKAYCPIIMPHVLQLLQHLENGDNNVCGS